MKKEIYRYKGSGKKSWLLRLKYWALVKLGLIDSPDDNAELESKAYEVKRARKKDQHNKEIEAKVREILKPNDLKVKVKYYEIKEDLLYGDNEVLKYRGKYLEVTDLVSAREIIALRMIRVNCALMELRLSSLDKLKTYEPGVSPPIWGIKIDRGQLSFIASDVYTEAHKYDPEYVTVEESRHSGTDILWWEMSEGIEDAGRYIRAYAKTQEEAESLAYKLNVGCQVLRSLAGDYRTLDLRIYDISSGKFVYPSHTRMREKEWSEVSPAYIVEKAPNYEKGKPFLPAVYADGRTAKTQKDPDNPDILVPYSILVERGVYRHACITQEQIEKQMEVHREWLTKLKNL